MSQIETTLTAIVQLSHILDTCDPASGVSFIVRRGVMKDREAEDDDVRHRPKVLVETGNLEVARSIIEKLRLDLVRQLRETWLPQAIRDAAENQRLSIMASEYLENGTIPEFLKPKKRS